MSKDIVTVNGDTSLREVCKIMGEKHIGSVLVTTNNKPMGIFTERDLLSKVHRMEVDLMTSKVKDYASFPLTVVSPDFDIREAARVMSQLKIRRLPVVEDGKLIGVLTAADIVKAIGNAPANSETGSNVS